MKTTTSNVSPLVKDLGKFFALPLCVLVAPIAVVAVLRGKLTWGQFGRLCLNSLPCVGN